MSVGGYGIGHTRWRPTADLLDETLTRTRRAQSRVHTGFVEKHVELRERLIARVAISRRRLDTEVLAHLIDEGPAGRRGFVGRGGGAALRS